MASGARQWLERQTIALAGVAQAARLVDRVSTSGSCPPEFLQSSLHSLFTFEAEDVEQVFGGLAEIRLGLDTLAGLMDNEQAAGQREVVRYIFNLLFLERRFSRDQAMMAVVRSRLEHTSFRAEHFTNHSNDICHSVSGIYQDTLSTLKFRIKVSGNSQHLQNPQSADMIRALLLAGIRAAFLWRQLGGRRWKLVLQRRKIGQLAQQLSREAGVV